MQTDQIPLPNPLEAYALRIAMINEQAGVEQDVFARLRIVAPIYEGIRHETGLQVGVFRLCLGAIEREIVRQGGPSEFLKQYPSYVEQ